MLKSKIAAHRAKKENIKCPKSDCSVHYDQAASLGLTFSKCKSMVSAIGACQPIIFATKSKILTWSKFQTALFHVLVN